MTRRAGRGWRGRWARSSRHRRTCRWATPACWRHGGRDYLLVANEKGELRLLDPTDGRELWKLDGLGPCWPTLVPGRTHVLVNGVPDSLVYWYGDRLVSRGDSYHGPSHGGRHPWSHWKVADGEIRKLPGTMDLSAFMTASEVGAEVPLVAGRMYERTQSGGVICYDLRAE